MAYILVAMGGILGAMARFSLSKWVGSRWGASFPYGTFFINVFGSFLLGFGVLLFLKSGAGWQKDMNLFFNVGFLGAFTTFSTFGYEAVHLIEQGQEKRAFIYVAGSAVVGIAGAVLGMGLYHLIF